MTPQVDLSGQVAVVTGGGRGIGRAHALMLASRGAIVVVNDVDREAASAVVAEVRDLSGQAACSPCDIADADGGREVIRQALEAFGRVDVVIHNAGIGGGAAFDELTDSVFDAVLTSTFAVRSMSAARHGRS